MTTFNLAPQQLKMVQRARELKGRLLFACEPRTGKTRAALAYLEEVGAERIIIVAPVTAAGVWRAEAEALGFYLPVYLALQSDLNKRAQALKDWLAIHPHCAVITNYQSYWSPKIAPILMSWKPDSIIPDEAQALKNRTSRQSKFAHRLAMLPSVKYRLALTGTPITNSIQDIFSIYKFIQPSVFGVRWIDFASKYLEFGYFGEVTGSRNDEDVKRRIEANSVQVARSEAWGGMPNRQDRPYPVVLTEESSARYREFSKEWVAAVSGTDVEGNAFKGTLSADLVITQAMRLQQLVGGHTKIDGQIVDVSSEKIDAAVDLAEQVVDAGERVVLFCAFRREIARLYDALSRRYPNNVGVLQGTNSKSAAEDRTDTISNFQHGKFRVLICQNQVAAKSIDLAAASTGIVVSTGYSLDDFLQFRERLTGIDPNRSFEYVYLQAQHPSGKPTIDARIYDILSSKRSIAGRFLSLDYAINSLFS